MEKLVVDSPQRQEHDNFYVRAHRHPPPATCPFSSSQKAPAFPFCTSFKHRRLRVGQYDNRRMEVNVNELQGGLLARAHACPQDVKTLISKLPGAILGERTSNETAMQGLKEQLQAAKTELDGIDKSAQHAEQDDRMKAGEILLKEKEARIKAEAEIARLKSEIDLKTQLIAEGTQRTRMAEPEALLAEKKARQAAEAEAGRLTTEVEEKNKIVAENRALRFQLRALMAMRQGKLPPTEPAAMREGLEAAEAPKGGPNMPPNAGQEEAIKRKAEYPAPMVERRGIRHGRKREREEPDLLGSLEESFTKRFKIKMDGKEGLMRQMTPVCGNCHNNKLECDGKSTCNHCGEKGGLMGPCLYRRCSNGAKCANTRCTFAHPDAGGMYEPRKTWGMVHD